VPDNPRRPATAPRPNHSRATNSPVSVWDTAQRNSRAQRTGRYTPHSVAHPAKMMPAIARHMIEHYTRPGEIVLDPMCGIGTTLVEAIHLGRDGLGIEYEQRWATYAEENVALNNDLGATGHAQVIHADARTLPDAAPARYHGRVSLVITSPPYGASLHGQVTAEKAEHGSVKKSNYRYSTDKGNLAHVGRDHLIDGFAAILAGCAHLLKPGGIVAVTARPWRERGQLVDLPTDVFQAGAAAGLEPVERTVALLAAVRDSRLILRPSFFQLSNLRKDRARGVPHHLIIHEDVLVLRKNCP
jgi:modification methylase